MTGLRSARSRLALCRPVAKLRRRWYVERGRWESEGRKEVADRRWNVEGRSAAAGEGDADKAVEHATDHLEGGRLGRRRLLVAEVTRENILIRA